MGLSKQARAQPAPAPGSGAASRSPRSAPQHSPQPAASHGILGPANWGAKVPASSYLIVPMGGQPAQVGASSPCAPHLPGARSGTMSRVSLRPPQQVLSVQPALPGILSPQPSTSTSAMGKKMASSANAQMPKPVPSLVSATSKRSVQKEPLLKPHPELSETVRSKFRETLAAALCVDSDDQGVQQSASNGLPIRYSSDSKHADDGTVHRPNTCISHSEGNAGTGTDPKSVGSISKQDDILSCRILGSDMAIKVSKDAQKQSIHVRLENNVLVNNTVVPDELLQDHGPLCAPDIIVGVSESIVQLNSKRATTSDIYDGVTISLNVPDFKRTKIADGATGRKNVMMQKGQSLALAIEEELFKLFGEVNKKYKEKGRSLLFNLKDKSNPLLRERVLSGDITPKCLCSMTTDELASKELSMWRLAKAEELAKMVVRPDKEVDVRRLVRKTHKGEFHVEVEETDTISVGIELESDLLSHGRTKSDDKVSVHREDIESDNTVQDGFAEIGNSNLLSNLKCLANEKTDPIQERMVRDLKYAENFPEMMSLDEFVEAPDSDIPLEYHSTETAQDDPSCTDKAYLALKPEKNHIGEDNADPSEFEFACDPPEDNCQASTKSPKKGSNNDFTPDRQLKGCVLMKSSSEMMYAEKLDTGSAPISGSTMQLKAISDDALTNESLWEGTIVLTLCSPIDVVAIFKSGEKPSTNEWSRFVEIKGRVRLTDFRDFLEQLPTSKSRTVTVTELRWKEGSRESVQRQFSQAMDSYAEDEKVGLFKLAEGVELYLCPYQGNAAQILSEHLPKEHSGNQTMAGISVVGVFVWRRSPRICTETPTRLDDSKRQPMSISRKQKAVISSSVPMPSRLSRPPASHFAHSNERPRLEEDATGDAPGFGHGVVKAEADLPEYDFTSVSTRSPSIATPHRYQSQQHLQSVSPPADQVSRIVHKYSSMYASEQSWYGGDYLPEWDQSWYDEMQLPPSPVPHVYSLPRQHAMTMQPLWHHRHMLHPAEAQSAWPSGWRFGTHTAHQARFAMDPDELAFLGRAREPWRGSRRRR